VRFPLDHDVPDDMEYSLAALGHAVLKLRDVLPSDDFLTIAGLVPHAGLVILIRRRSRAQERAALVHLLDNAGESGLRGNINFA